MRTTEFPEPTSDELREHLVGLLFGFEDLLSGVILTAYGDLARTLGGISRHPNAADLKAEAVALLRDALSKSVAQASEEETFDAWHRTTSVGLREVYVQGQFDRFSFGHAQKWINMSVKYLILLEDRAVAGAAKLLPTAHTPLDSIILGVLHRDYDLLTASCEPWSKITDYEVYMALQRSIRATFSPSFALSAELRLWRPEPNAGPTKATAEG